MALCVLCVQALEREQSSSWVRRVEVGGKPGREFHRRGLTLLQVVLHTGRQVGRQTPLGLAAAHFKGCNS